MMTRSLSRMRKMEDRGIPSCPCSSGMSTEIVHESYEGLLLELTIRGEGRKIPCTWECRELRLGKVQTKIRRRDAAEKLEEHFMLYHVYHNHFVLLSQLFHVLSGCIAQVQVVVGVPGVRGEHVAAERLHPTPQRRSWDKVMDCTPRSHGLERTSARCRFLKV